MEEGCLYMLSVLLFCLPNIPSFGELLKIRDPLLQTTGVLAVEIQVTEGQQYPAKAPQIGYPCLF